MVHCHDELYDNNEDNYDYEEVLNCLVVGVLFFMSKKGPNGQA